MAANSTPSLIVLVLSSSLLTAAFSQLVSFWLRARQFRKSASYLALRLALIFESFGEDCLAWAQDYDNAVGTGGVMGGFRKDLPNLSTLPDDGDGWRELPSDLSASALGFPSLVRATQHAIDFPSQQVDTEEAFKECRNECVRLGIQAADLAAKLRRRMKLPAVQSTWNWVSELTDLHREGAASPSP